MISTIGNKNDAHLLVYQLKLTSRRDYEAKLNRTLKKFTSKPITQVYEEISGNEIKIRNNLPTFQ